MLEFVIAAIIFILSTALSIVSSKTPLYSIKKKNIEVYKSGWQAISLITAIVLMFGLQNYLNGIDVNNAKKDAATERKDSENRIRSDYGKSVESITKNYEQNTGELKDEYTTNAIDLKNRYDTSTTNIVKALAEYGLSYNKRTNKLESLIRDSVRARADPTFDLLEINKQRESDTAKWYALIFISKDAGCRNVDVDISMVVSDYLEGPYVFCGNERYKESQFGMYDEKTKYEGINRKIKYYNLVFFIIKGTYQNTDQSKLFPIETVMCFNVNTERTTSVSGQTKEEIYRFIGYYGH